MQQSAISALNKDLRVCRDRLLCSALNSASGTTVWDRGVGERDAGFDQEGDAQSSVRTACGRATATGEGIAMWGEQSRRSPGNEEVRDER